MTFGTVLIKYGLSQEQFEKALESYKKYEKSGMIDSYDKKCKEEEGKYPNRVIHYIAGTLELMPANTKVGLKVIQDLKSSSRGGKEYKEHKISQLVIDNIMRDPKLTQEEKMERIAELERAEYERVSKIVDEANRKQGTDKYRVEKEEEIREIG